MLSTSAQWRCYRAIRLIVNIVTCINSFLSLQMSKSIIHSKHMQRLSHMYISKHGFILHCPSAHRDAGQYRKCSHLFSQTCTMIFCVPSYLNNWLQFLCCPVLGWSVSQSTLSLRGYCWCSLSIMEGYCYWFFQIKPLENKESATAALLFTEWTTPATT